MFTDIRFHTVVSVAQAFTPRRVAALRPRIERITADLLDDLAARAPGPVDLVAGYSYQLPMRVIGELFEIPTDRLDQLRAITRSLVSSPTPTSWRSCWAGSTRGRR
jgi:cytochrome P450